MPGYPDPDWASLFDAVSRHREDVVAWSKLFGELWPYLAAWLTARYGLDSDDARDVCQEVLYVYREKARSTPGELGPMASLPYLLTFARYQALNWRRKNRQWLSLADLHEGSRAATGSEEEVLRAMIVEDALDRLDKPCAHLLRSRYFHGLTSAELAARLHKSPQAIDNQLHRCRARFRKLVLGLP